MTPEQIEFTVGALEECSYRGRRQDNEEYVSNCNSAKKAFRDLLKQTTWHPLSELSGPSRYVLVSGPQGVEQGYYRNDTDSFWYCDKSAFVNDLDDREKYRWMNLPEGHKP